TRPEDVAAARSKRSERQFTRPPEPLVSVPRSGVGPTPTLVAAGPLFGAAAAAPGPRNGEPRFRMIRRLGAGGFGKVWLAHDAKLGHEVALKAAHTPDAETEERIRREATALGSVRHPNCVRIFDLVDARSDPGLAELEGMVLVMEHVEGTPLGELVRSRGLLDDIAAARAWASVAGALDAAHTRGVMHRDVKPGNVIVDAAGYAHLIDFGIARRTGDATLTVAGFVLGTPDFLAPEVAGGRRATPQSDSWQLAATISYALTGHPPRGTHGDAVSGLRAAAAGAPLSQLPARSAHTALLHAAMHNDPAQRPPLSAARDALESWLRSVDAAPDGPVTQVTRR
ncbi:serine/threonine-protein kinase, partial [Pseudonocardia abyssalis]